MPSFHATAIRVACVLVLAAGSASAQVDRYIGKPIATVRLVSEGRDTTDPSLIDIVETRVGQPLSMGQVRETITHLYSLGRFEGITVDASLVGTAVALRYDLVPVHPVAKIVFAGALHAPGVDVNRLRRAIIDRFGLSPPLGRSVGVQQAVVDALHEVGYLHPDVRTRYDLEHAPERATLVLDVTPGARTSIGTIDVAGAASEQERRELLSKLHIVRGAPYEKLALDDRIARYLEERRKNGYYEAKLDAAVHLADNDRTANLALVLNAGARVRVVFAGDSLPAERRRDLVPVEREGSVDEDLLEDSSNRIEDYLRGLGYRAASAPHTREEKNGELLITFTVKRGPLSRVGRLEIAGNAAIPLAEIEPALQLRDGAPFSEARLQRDIGTIQGMYRRRGFADVAVQPTLERSGAAENFEQMFVRLTIREGARTIVGSVKIQGNETVPEASLRPHLGLAPDQPFYGPQMAADRDALQLAYSNLGYENATVDARTAVDGPRVNVSFVVREGPRVFVGHILIVGNIRTSQKTILRALQISPGDPLGEAAVNEAQQRLASLGLFRRARIAELRHGDETTRDLLVTVEEAPATTIAYGAGGEVRSRVVTGDNGVATEQLEFAPRASFQIGRRNLWGKNRSIDLFTSLSLHPTDSPVFSNQPTVSSSGGYGFPEYRVQATFREPRVFDTAADAYLTGTLEQQIRSSFNFARQSAGAVVARRVTRNVSVTGSYQLQHTRVFDIALNINPFDVLSIYRLFPQVRLSSFSSSVIRDTRDDQVDPHTGDYLSANGQLAARAIGSEVGFAKTFFTAQYFRPVPHVPRIVFAGSARLGLAIGFERIVIDSAGNTEHIKDLPISERFFAGGDTTVRGFALDRLGVQHIPAQPTDTLDQDGFPLGGNGLIVFNGEVRAPLRWGLSAVTFVDSGQVFATPSNFDLTQLRGSVGFGVRWKSPIGPFRIDYGFKTHRNVMAGGIESPGQLWISFGQAF